ncbi:Uncharacterized protein GBIM_00685 [Gryllus bimaculatus]|nr:Uncharacterized protein GBIM_00685 [Gryllus bimaculatus]
MYRVLNGVGTSREMSSDAEFQFLEKWVFSSCLESRLKEFANSTMYKFAIKTINSSNDNSKPIPEQDVETQTNGDEVTDNRDEHMDIENVEEIVSQSFLLSTQNCTKLVANLREGPISEDELSKLSIEDIAMFTNEGSSDIIFNFCESVCSAPQYQQRFVPILCEKLLLPKIKDPTFATCSRILMPTIKRTFETFPAEACSYLLLPLIQESDYQRKLDQFLTDLDNGSKQTILKSLLEGDIKILEDRHLSVLQNLLVTTVDKNMNEKLVDLLLASGNNLCKSSNFGKLLVCVTEQIGPTLDSDVKNKLFSAIQTHKSIQKARVMKAFQSLSL